MPTIYFSTLSRHLIITLASGRLRFHKWLIFANDFLEGAYLTINTRNFPLGGEPFFSGPSQLNPSYWRAAASCTVPFGSPGEIGRKKKWSGEERWGEEVSAKTEVKRYIWLNGRRSTRVYKAFYIYRISVVARFLYRGDKRSSSTTDLLGWGVFPDSTMGPGLPFPL